MIHQGSPVVAYETDSLEDKTKIHCFLSHVAVDSNPPNRRPIGIPIFLSFDASLSCAQIYDKILPYVTSYAKIDSSGLVTKDALISNLRIASSLRSNLRIRVENQDGQPTETIIPSDANETLPAMFGDRCRDSFIWFALEWVDIVNFGPSGSITTQIHWANFTSTTCHQSYLEQEKKLSSSDPTSVSLYECFESFTQPGKLVDGAASWNSFTD